MDHSAIATHPEKIVQLISNRKHFKNNKCLMHVKACNIGLFLLGKDMSKNKDDPLIDLDLYKCQIDLGIGDL